MGSLFNQIVNALLLGATYTLAAVGFSLFFGVIDTVVFCVGDIAMFGAFGVLAFYGIAVSLGLAGIMPSWAITVFALAGGSILCVLVSIAVYRIGIKPFENAHELIPLLSTIALGIVLRESVGLFYPQGRNPHAFPALLPYGHLFHIRAFSDKGVIILGTTVLLLIVLFWFTRHTRMGKSMQAISQNRQAAMMVGINPDKVITITFVIAGILLGIGGFLIGSYFDIVRFDMGIVYGLKGFCAAVVGGLGNIYGAIVGSMLIAFVEVFASGFISGGTAYASIFAYMVVVLFMVFKPEGILGEPTIEKV